MEKIIKKIHKINCQCLGCRAKRGELNGKNNYSYINGESTLQHYCNCGAEITYHAKLCTSCANKIKNLGRKRPDISLLFKGIKRPEFSKSMSGKGNPRYIDGRTSLYRLIKNLQEYKIWRKTIYDRDGYKCKECGEKGKDRNLECHHIKEFRIILDEFLSIYNNFSPIEDKETLVRLAVTYEPFWNIDNGKTLCKKCHDKTKYLNQYVIKKEKNNGKRYI